MSEKPSAGWYQRPLAPEQDRYWDGEQWTDEVRPRAPAADHEAPPPVARPPAPPVSDSPPGPAPPPVPADPPHSAIAQPSAAAHAAAAGAQPQPVAAHATA